MTENKPAKELTTISNICNEFPLHFTVWHDQHQVLHEELLVAKDEIERKDPRGRTPLMLAIKLKRPECVRVLLEHGANTNSETDGWSAVQEANATGDKNILKMVNERRSYQRKCDQFAGIPELLSKLKEAPDFYVEINWEFTSWMPLVTRMCPSDTYRVYKQGAKVRVDATLVGFEEFNWSRGNTSIIFEAHDNFATIIELNHQRQRVYYDQRSFVAPEDASQIKEDSETIKSKLRHPIHSSYIDTDKISFERSKRGVWGWRQDRIESIDGYECKVFTASNVELITRTRFEHLTAAQKEKYRKKRNSWQTMFGFSATEVEKIEEGRQSADTESDEAVNERLLSEPKSNRPVTIEEYFTEDYDLEGRDLGVPKEMTTKIRKFRANLWLCKDYPLSLQEQIMPIVNLMATSSTNFAKLKDFIEMQLPAGFPVKIEIPLFHVMNAHISFNNIFAAQKPVLGVTCIREEQKLMCDIDESLFTPPSYYKFIDVRERETKDDDLLQIALQNNFMADTENEGDRMDVWEALQARRPNTPDIPEDDEERELQRAIEASLSLDYGNSVPGPDALNLPEGERNASATTNDLISVHREDKDLMTALSLSLKEETERERNQKLEEEMLQEALRISINEK